MINIDDIVRIQKIGVGDILGSYTNDNIILFDNSNDLYAGYGKILSVEERNNFIIATAENCLYDFYYDKEHDDIMPVKDLTKLLRKFGFVKEVEVKIDRYNTFSVWANLKTGAIVVVDPENDEDEKNYYRISVTITTENALPYDYEDMLGFESGTEFVQTFELMKNKTGAPLQSILNVSNNSTDWHGEVLDLSTHADPLRVNFSSIEKRIDMCKHDLRKLFNIGNR